MLKARIIKTRRELRADVSLELARGSSLALFGASGAGKSTVLACIAGIEEPDDGHVEVNGVKVFPPSLPLHKRPIGYLTQEPGLFPHLSVSENINFGMSRDRRQEKEQVEWISTLRDRLHLAPLWNAPAALISGGQARRVSLARMLARKPPLLLLDEPFAGLDRGLVRELIDSLLFWSKTIGFSMIAVDHQAEVLRRLCPEQVVALEQGRIVQQGGWDELCSAPATSSLRSLLSPL
ncbi:MAG TPA: ATP-binding cassette domain-containing protein [Candidatus Angelobacter sp.]|jgi:ABC-type sulfate/molybdate transport systems ATPase subunit|nr:ATP-binding cassette domain-containing protein [Candidatus Angelobacter sp.]